MFSKINKDNLRQSLYLMMDDISSESCKSAIEWIVDSNMGNAEEHPRPEVLTLMISSMGGDVHAAFSLADIMQASSIPIQTVGSGVVASAGLYILMAGTPGRRFVTENTLLMSHRFSTSIEGSHAHLMSQVKSFDIVHKMILKHYVKFTNLSEEDVLKELLSPTDTYFNAKEAVKYGIVDKVSALS